MSSTETGDVAPSFSGHLEQVIKSYSISFYRTRGKDIFNRSFHSFFFAFSLGPVSENPSTRLERTPLKLLLPGTIRKDDCWNNVVTIRNNVVTISFNAVLRIVSFNITFKSVKLPSLKVIQFENERRYSLRSARRISGRRGGREATTGNASGASQANEDIAPYGPQFGLKIRGGGGPPWASPLDLLLET